MQSPLHFKILNMTKTSIIIKSALGLLIIAAISFIMSCTGSNGTTVSVNQSEIDSLRNQIKALTSGNEMITKNLITFDTLDYTVFTNQQWTRLHESHSKDIKVNWPDGHFTTGIERQHRRSESHVCICAKYQYKTTSDSFWIRKHDLCNWCYDRYIYCTDANR